MQEREPQRQWSSQEDRRYKEANKFLEPYFKAKVGETAEDFRKAMHEMAEGGLDFSLGWLKNGLTGLSKESKQLVREFWERIPDKDDEWIGKRTTILKAEIINRTQEEERQAIYFTMDSVALFHRFGLNLVRVAPQLFKLPEEN